LFFEGSTLPFLAGKVPAFELRKLSVRKLSFDPSELVDTLVRYKEKGSRAGKSQYNAERLIEIAITNCHLTFEKGDLPLFIEYEQFKKRTLDFIIPNKKKPTIIIESSFLVTTGSGQGDKSKTEIGLRALLKTHYPTVTFIGFVDGIGWLVRPGDLARLVSAFDDVFTFHSDELERFRELLIRKGGGHA